MSNIFPATTDDERDPREDQNEDRRREEEIKGEKVVKMEYPKNFFGNPSDQI